MTKISHDSANHLASLVFRAASAYATLESFLVGGAPSANEGGARKTKVHADVTTDEEISDLRRDLERGVWLAYQGVRSVDVRLLNPYRDQLIVARAVAFGRNRHSCSQAYAEMCIHFLEDVMERVVTVYSRGEKVSFPLDRVPCRELDCSGTLGAVIAGRGSVLICSDDPDHSYGIQEW